LILNVVVVVFAEGSYLHYISQNIHTNMKHFSLATLALATLVSLTSCSEKDGSESTSKETASTTTTTPAAATETPAPPMDSAAKMKAWMEYMTPGDAHKVLAAGAGSWKTETTMWMEPGAPAQSSTGKASNEMILGGRYQRTVHKSQMMGESFEGEGLTAYDNAKKLFVSSWVDNMGTGVMVLEGPWDESTKSMTLKGTCTDPTTGKDMAIREVYRIIDDTHHEMQMFCTQDGKEYKNMEMKMTKI
jgi:hypothetical protein